MSSRYKIVLPCALFLLGAPVVSTGAALMRIQPVVTLSGSGASDTAIGSLPASITSINAGSPFVVELWAQQVDASLAGLACVFCDLSFDDLGMVCDSTAPATDFIFFATGTCGVGSVTELGGCTFALGAGVTPAWVRVATVAMTATSGGTGFQVTPLAGSVASSIVAFGVVPIELIEFVGSPVFDQNCMSDADCDDGNLCTVGSCDAQARCVYSGSGITVPCDDGNSCTLNDSCQGDVAGTCVGQPDALPSVCDDGIACTIDDVCSNGTCTGAETCPAGMRCDAAAGSCILPPVGQLYCDDFNRASLGPDWVADNLSFSIIGNQLVEDSGATFAPGQLRWAGGTTDAIDQFGKIQVIDPLVDTHGFMFRVNAAPGEHYEVHLPGGMSTWRWERYDPFYQETKANCLGDGILSNGDYVGAMIEGTGLTTKVSVWRWNVDPDAGGMVDILQNWGPPDCTMEAVAAPYVDTGNSIGIRAYAGDSPSNEVADNWCGGDLSAVFRPVACFVDADCNDDDACNGMETCSLQGQCQDGAPLVCSDGNVCNGIESCHPIAGCVLGIPLTCDDGNVCTDDVCSPAAGCQYTSNTRICDDGMACTASDVCAGGICAGTESCPAGMQCDAATGSCAVPPAGQLYCDDFNRALLGPDWEAENLSFSIIGNQLVEDSRATFEPGQLRWTGGTTNTVDQFGKIQVIDPFVDTYGFMFRVNGTPGEHYEVHLPGGTSIWRWERYDPFYQETKANCLGDLVLSTGDYVGAMIEGTGLATKVSVWRWDGDPDGGGLVDALQNWGAPDCTMEAVAAPYVDTGTSIGIRAYAGNSQSNEVADNWCGGDVSAVVRPATCFVDLDCDDGDACNGVESCAPNGICQTGTPLVCDDGLFCNGAEICLPNVGCVLGTAPDCSPMTDACNDGICDDAVGSCVAVPVPVGTPCDDGNTCNGVETCSSAGVCQAGTPVVCDDGMFCNGTEVCVNGVGCVSGMAPDCTPLTDACNDGVCDNTSSACLAVPVPDGTSCDNGDACAGDTCFAGVCDAVPCGPLPPTNLTVRFDEQAKLRWTASPDPELSFYNLYRSTAEGGPYTFLRTRKRKKTKFDDEPRTSGFYCYIVTAVTTNGTESAPTNEVCGMVIR